MDKQLRSYGHLLSMETWWGKQLHKYSQERFIGHQHHHDNKEVGQAKISDDEFLDIEAENFDKQKNNEVESVKDSSFIFEESMLDEFLEKNV